MENKPASVVWVGDLAEPDVGPAARQLRAAFTSTEL